MIDQAQKLRDLMNKIQDISSSARVITVTSGKGGVGKTSFSVNLAIALIQRGLRVLVVDADFGLSNIDVMLGINSPYDLSHVIRNSVDVSKVVLNGPGGIQFISGGSGVDDLVNINGRQLDVLIENLVKLENIADFIIFDTGAGVSDRVIKMVTAVNEVILITTPEPTAVMDAYALVKMVSKSDEAPKFNLIMNKANSSEEAYSIMNSLTEIIKKYTKIQVTPMGYIVYDQAAFRAVKQQVPYIISYPKCKAAQNIGIIADKLLGTYVQDKKRGGIRQFIAKLARSN